MVGIAIIIAIIVAIFIVIPPWHATWIDTSKHLQDAREDHHQRQKFVRVL